MLGVETASEKIVTREGGERMFDQLRKALHEGGSGGGLPINREMHRYIQAVKRKLEQGLQQKSSIFKQVDISPFLKRFILELEEQGGI